MTQQEAEAIMKAAGGVVHNPATMIELSQLLSAAVAKGCQ